MCFTRPHHVSNTLIYIVLTYNIPVILLTYPQHSTKEKAEVNQTVGVRQGYLSQSASHFLFTMNAFTSWRRSNISGISSDSTKHPFIIDRTRHQTTVRKSQGLERLLLQRSAALSDPNAVRRRWSIHFQLATRHEMEIGLEIVNEISREIWTGDACGT